MEQSGSLTDVAIPDQAVLHVPAQAPTSTQSFSSIPSGKLLKSFGAGLFINPHKLVVDKEGYLWLADNGGYQVFKLSQDGEVLLTLGKKGVAGAGFDEFDAPTAVAIAPNGDIFVGDGHPEAVRPQAMRGS